MDRVEQEKSLMPLFAGLLVSAVLWRWLGQLVGRLPQQHAAYTISDVTGVRYARYLLFDPCTQTSQAGGL